MDLNNLLIIFAIITSVFALPQTRPPPRSKPDSKGDSIKSSNDEDRFRLSKAAALGLLGAGGATLLRYKRLGEGVFDYFLTRDHDGAPVQREFRVRVESPHRKVIWLTREEVQRLDDCTALMVWMFSSTFASFPRLPDTHLHLFLDFALNTERDIVPTTGYRGRDLASMSGVREKW